MKKKITKSVINTKYIVLFISLISIMIIVGALFYYKNEESSIKIKEHNNLRAVAELKINQLTQWLNERIGDAKILSSSPFFAKNIGIWFDNQDNQTLKNDIKNRFLQYKNIYSYRDVFLCSKNGEILIASNTDKHLDSITIQKIKVSFDSNRIVFTDFYYCNIHNDIHFDIITPVYNEKNESFAVIIIRIAPEEYIFPLIQSWPTPSKTAETIIIRKDKDSVLFLNELRHKKNTALKYKLSLKELNAPGVQAVKGYEGIYEGIDYRGIKVLSEIRNVSNTNWYMIAKVDKSEIYAELNYRSIIIIAFVIVLICILSIGIFWIYHYRQRNIYYQLYHNEKELHEIQKEFQTTLYSIGDAVITTDTSGKIKMMNPIAEQITGWTESEAKDNLIQEVFNIVNEKTRIRVDNPVDLVLKNGKIIGLANHTILISKDGKEFPIADSGAPIINENGEITGVVLVFRDQTEEYLYQQELIESETRYKSLHNASFGGIAIHDNGIILDCNQGLSEISGYSYEELIGMNGLILFAEKYRDEAMTNILSGYEKPYESIGLQKNGIEYPIRIEARNIPYKGKSVRCFEFRNITEQKLSEEKLKESEERFRTIFENASIGLYRSTPEGKVILANQMIVKLLGYSSFEELANIDLNELGYACPEDRIRFKELIEQNDRINGFESTWRNKNGGIVFIRESSNIYRNPDGSIKFYEGTVEDITERKKAEEALRESEAFIRTVMDNLPIGVAVNSVGPDVEFEYINDNFLKIYRTTKEALAEKGAFWETVYEDEETRKKIKKLVLSDIASGDAERMHWKDIPIKRKGEETSYISAMNTPIPGRTLMISTVWDVTDRLKAENLLIQRNKELETQYEEYARLNELLVQTNYDLEIAKSKAEESEERHRFLFENTIQGVVYHSNTGEIIYANKAAADILGLTIDQMNGLTAKDPRWRAIHEDGSDYPGDTHPCSITLKTSKPVFNKVMGVFNPQKNSYNWININSIPKFKNNDSMPYQVVVTFEDITKRKQFEEKLKHFNNLMQYIISHAKSAIAILDKNMKYVYVSERFLKDYNLTDTNIIGKNHYDIFTDLSEKWLESHKKGLNGEITGSEEEAFYRADGLIEWIRWECRPWYEADGSIAGIILYTEVITDRKKAEQALKESYEMLFNLTERVPGVVYQYRLWPDGHSAFPYSSQGMFDIYEVTSEEVKEDASIVFTRIHPDDLDYVSNAIYESEKNQSFFQVEFRVVLPKKGLRWCSSNAKPTLLDDGSTLWYGIIIDITDLKSAQEELLHKNKELEAQYEEYMKLNEVLRETNYDLEIAKSKAEESDNLKTAFLQNMSHEIRTPLNGILGFSKLLNEQDISKEEITEYTDIINQSGNRLLEIVNNVLDIAKIETGQIVVNNTSFPVISVIKDLYNFFATMAKAKNLQLNIVVSQELENLIVFTDISKISQILSNLINNAIKFTQEGNIDFGYEIKDNLIQFFVKDTGIGISKEHQLKIFERFAQVDLSITRGFEGAGLGLAICKGLVEILDGKIWVDSDLDKGSSFFFTIPLKQYLTKIKNFINETDFTFDFHSLKVLIVEDEITSFKYLMKILQNDKITVLHAVNGLEAIELVKNTPDIDLILMDIRMPVLDGFEATKQIKILKPDIPVIAQTAYAFSSEKERILKAGFNDYITKPIEYDKLLSIINKELSKAKKQN